jgi:hypothetical protein
MSRELEFARKMEKMVEQAPENRHSYFQLKYFVIGKEPTLQAQMWQCLRELQARKETLDSIALEIEDTEDQLEIMELEKEETPIENLSKISQVKLRRWERQKTSLQKTLKQLENRHKFALQEARFFMQAFESLEKIEPMKDYDDLEAQQEYWNEVIGQKINLKMLLQQPLDTELVQTALSLHENAPVKAQITQLLDRQQQQMAYIREKQKQERLKALKSKENNAEAFELRQAVQTGQIVGIPAENGQQKQSVSSAE